MGLKYIPIYSYADLNTVYCIFIFGLIISKEYRETLGDIASEVGDRQKNIDITTKGKPIIMEDVVKLLDQRDRKKRGK